MALHKFRPLVNFSFFSSSNFYWKTSFYGSCSSLITKFELEEDLLNKAKNCNILTWSPRRSLSLSSPLLKKIYTKVQDKGTRRPPRALTDIDLEDEEEDFKDVELNSMLYKAKSSFWDISSVAVLQPWIKWGAKKRRETSPDILLDEACSLVRSLPFMTVSYKEYISLQAISKARVFGTGNLTRLRNDIRESRSDAVFISINHLTQTQKSELEMYLGVKVFDRFFLVLAIFKHHANTIEARLQIAMAELLILNKENMYEKEKLMLNRKEAKLKEELRRLEMRREGFRKSRRKSCIPSVAVVGYTNCGKTTLIRAITGDERAQGEDRLFATMDATAHKGVLPCGLSVVFMDSVGFIQDIPTSLIASFTATLQEIVSCDVVVLVRDVSNPDIVGQMNTVHKTLQSIHLPADTPVISVNNKVDLLEEDTELDESIRDEGVFVSSTRGDGLNELLVKIEREVLRVTGRQSYLMRLLTGSQKIEWLKVNGGVTTEHVDERDPQYTVVRVVLNEAEKAAFKKAFNL